VYLLRGLLFVLDRKKRLGVVRVANTSELLVVLVAVAQIADDLTTRRGRTSDHVRPTTLAANREHGISVIVEADLVDGSRKEALGNPGHGVVDERAVTLTATGLKTVLAFLTTELVLLMVTRRAVVRVSHANLP